MRQLIPIENNKDVPGGNYSKVVINLRYNPSYSVRNIVTQHTYLESILLLDRAKHSKQEIRFGEMGTGLKPLASFQKRILSLFRRSRNSVCEFNSKGLAVIEESEKSSVIYSFYGPT